MITLRRSDDRGYADHGWLRSFHSFSFAGYQDPRHMGFGNLRVINEDRVAPGTGFGAHGHRDMEIVSVVLSGALSHQDSLGNGSVIRPGDVQRMSAGTGIRHSERNEAIGQETHFLQIWFLPDEPGGQPGYEQRSIDAAAWSGRLQPLVSPDGRGGSLRMRADAVLSGVFLDGQERLQVPLDQMRLTYLHLVSGSLVANGHPLEAGDALLMESEKSLELDEGRQAQLLVFDLKPLS